VLWKCRVSVLCRDSRHISLCGGVAAMVVIARIFIVCVSIVRAPAVAMC